MVAGAMNPVLLVGEDMFTKGGELTGTLMLFVTVWAVKDVACPPAGVCKEFVEGLV